MESIAQVALPPQQSPPALTLEERLELAIKALKFYANPDNAEDEMDGYAFVSGTSPLVEDGGRRARKALKELREAA